MVQNFITVNPAIYSMYMCVISKYSQVKYERIEMHSFGTVTHSDGYKTT
jgi:hypothetical protein